MIIETSKKVKENLMEGAREDFGYRKDSHLKYSIPRDVQRRDKSVTSNHAGNRGKLHLINDLKTRKIVN